MVNVADPTASARKSLARCCKFRHQWRLETWFSRRLEFCVAGLCNAYDRRPGAPLGGFDAARRLLLPSQSGRCRAAPSAPQIGWGGGGLLESRSLLRGGGEGA